MDERIDNSPEMTPQTIQFLEQLFRSPEALRPPRAEEPTTALLVSYLCSALPKDAFDRVEAGLTTYPTARQRFRQTSSVLKRLQSVSWGTVQAEALAGDTVAQAWMAFASERADVVLPTTARMSFPSWTKLPTEVEEGLVQAQALWTAWCGFGEQLVASLTRPKIAEMMGSEETEAKIVGELPMGVTSTITTAEIAMNGDLQVALSLQDAQGGAFQGLAGRPVQLALQCGGEYWPLTSAPLIGDRVEFLVPNIAEALDLPPGHLPHQYLHLTLGDALSVERPPRYVILAQIVDANNQPTGQLPVEVEIHGEPHREPGILTLEIALPFATRAAYPTHQLRVEMAVSAQSRQYLGAWPVRNWDTLPRTLTIAYPGNQAGRLPFLSSLRFSLQQATPL